MFHSSVENIPEVRTKMKNKYETLCITTKKTIETTIKKLKEKFLKIDPASKIEVNERKLAYQIRGEEVSVDLLAIYHAEKETIGNLIEEIKSEQGVLREMTINLSSKKSSIGVKVNETERKIYNTKLNKAKEKKNAFLRRKEAEENAEVGEQN